jgi:hypothetical protein
LNHRVAILHNLELDFEKDIISDYASKGKANESVYLSQMTTELAMQSHF